MNSAHNLVNFASDEALGGMDLSHCGNEGLGHLYELCLQVFGHLYQDEPEQNNPRKKLVGEGMSALFLWGKGFDYGELDKAVEPMDDMKRQVMKPLAGIASLLLHEVTPTPARASQIRELESIVKSTKFALPAITDRRPNDNQPKGANEKTASIARAVNLSDEIRLQIGLLNELAPELKKNLRLHRESWSRTSHSSSGPFKVSDSARAYISWIRDKYPSAEIPLVERLGEYVWQKHVALRRQMEKTHSKTKIPSSLADCEEMSVSTFRDSAVGTSLQVKNQCSSLHASSDQGLSQTEHKSIRIPAPPLEVYAGIPFECYLCGQQMTNIKSRLDWKKHLFADLRPYICTFSDCRDEQAQFSSRSRWANHEFSKHRIVHQWRCDHCDEAWGSAGEWENHFRKTQSDTLTEIRMGVAKSLAYSPQETPVEHERCPFCHITRLSSRAFEQHVGRHLEEMALMAVPRTMEDESEPESDSSLASVHGKGSGSDALLGAGDNGGYLNQERALPRPPSSGISGIPFDQYITPPSRFASSIEAKSVSLRAPVTSFDGELVVNDGEGFICPDCPARFRRIHDLERHNPPSAIRRIGYQPHGS